MANQRRSERGNAAEIDDGAAGGERVEELIARLDDTLVAGAMQAEYRTDLPEVVPEVEVEGEPGETGLVLLRLVAPNSEIESVFDADEAEALANALFSAADRARTIEVSEDA